MITYNKIGHYGRSGNQLFQLASTYGIAKKIGAEVYFPIENVYQSVEEHFKDGITRNICFDIPKYFEFDTNLLKPISEINVEYEYREPHFHFSDTAFTVPDSCNIHGYYQSEKYFKHCEDDIRRLLTFKPEIVQSTSNIFSDLLKKDKLTSVHIRLGDYVGLQEYHPVLATTDYYQNAMQLLSDNTNTWVIFSDNISHCKDIFSDNPNIVYIEQGSDIEQMCLMSMCDNHIIANSSFSWWSAWLCGKKDKCVVAPKNWFGIAYSNTHNTKDLYPNNWNII